MCILIQFRRILCEYVIDEGISHWGFVRGVISIGIQNGTVAHKIHQALDNLQVENKWMCPWDLGSLIADET